MQIFRDKQKNLIGCRETFADDLKNDFAKETDLMFDSNMDVKIKMVQASNGSSSGLAVDHRSKGLWFES